MTAREVSCLLWRDGCLHQVNVRHEGRPVTIWIPCDRYRAFERQLDAEHCWISVVPRTAKQDWVTGLAPALWCYLRDLKGERALTTFRPVPTFVWRAHGTHHRWALWALSRPLWGSFIEQATERLAYALHGFRRAAKSPTLIPSPFSEVEIGSKPRSMYVEFEQPEIYTPRQVVGHLPDAPVIDRSQWKRAA